MNLRAWVYKNVTTLGRLLLMKLEKKELDAAKEYFEYKRRKKELGTAEDLARRHGITRAYLDKIVDYIEESGMSLTSARRKGKDIDGEFYAD